MTPGMVDLLRFLRGRMKILQDHSATLTEQSRRLRTRSCQLRTHSMVRERVLQRLCCRHQSAA